MSRSTRATPDASVSLGEDGLSRHVAWWLLVAAVVAYVALSASALMALGIPYDSPEGSFLVKIHPGTYLAVLSLAIGLCSAGHPVAAFARQLNQYRLLAVYLLCMLAVFMWAVLRHGPSGLAFIIDTLCMPAVVLLSMTLHARRRQHQLLLWVMGLLVFNALLAIAEFGLRWRFLPLYAGREDFVEEDFFRSSALFGHPLSNSLKTLALLPAVLLLPWGWPVRLGAGLVLVLGLLTFGSRAAMAALAIYLVVALLPLLSRLVRGRFNYIQIMAGLLGSVVGAAVLAGVVVVTGLGERIFKNLTWDNSADVRRKVWDVLDYVHGADFWLGVPVAQIDAIAQRIGLDPRYEAIENFWLYLLLLLGVCGFVVFVGGLMCLLVYLWRQAAAPMRLAMVVYLLVASSANTLAAKSVSLILLGVVIQASARPRRQVWARTARGSGAVGSNWTREIAVARGGAR